MRPHVCVLLCVLCLVCPALADDGDGVIVPNGRFAERICAVGPEGVAELVMAPPAYTSELPAEDRGKFRLSVFTGPNCPPCTLLERDLKEAPALRGLVEWVNVDIVPVQEPSQAARVRAFQVSRTPTIVLYPSPGSARFPYAAVAREIGYDGDAEQLAARMVAALKRFYAKYPAGPQQPAGPPEIGADDRFPPVAPQPEPALPDTIPPQPAADKSLDLSALLALLGTGMPGWLKLALALGAGVLAARHRTRLAELLKRLLAIPPAPPAPPAAA